tara:strand:+ start:1006 stop:1206 length:201 start_codon:yes stop_codon:yes gene_type:complete
MASPQLFEIIVFDDGNQRFKNYDNKWIIIGSRFNGQKIALKNISDKSIIIRSISSWKIRPIMGEPS